MQQYISLAESYKKQIEARDFLVSKMMIKEEKIHYVISFTTHNLLIASCYSFIEKTFDKAKNCFYEAAMAESYLYETFKQQFFGTLGTPANYLLSDNESLIKKFCQYTDTQEAQKVGPTFYQMGKAIQHSILNDELALIADIEMIKKRTKSGVGKYFIDTIDFFEGIIEKDEHKIFNSVNAMQKKLQRYQFGMLKDYFAFEATGLAKLAWRKGFEIDFKNKFIPQELLPIKELEHYESFDFFNEPNQ